MKPTQEQVIAWAREARLAEPSHPFNPWGANDEALERFAALVAAAEREACAKEIDKWIGCDLLAAAIRARGQS